MTDFDRIQVPHVVIYVAAASTHSLYSYVIPFPRH